MKRTMDLGVADVHIDSSVPIKRPLMDDTTDMADDKMYECLLSLDMMKFAPDDDNKDHDDEDDDKTDENRRDMISSVKRKSLPEGEFALPTQRKYPIDTAARVRNAAARLEQQKSSMSPSDYSAARSRIASAARRFGITSEYNKRKMDDDGGGDDGGGDEGGDDGGTDMTRTCRGDSIQLSKNVEDKPVWIQIAKQGKFKGHSHGPFEMTRVTFQEIIRNFEAQENKFIPLDFEHASEQRATEGSIPYSGAPAQGWLTKLRIGDDENLWGLCTWGDLAKKYIRAGQYKFLSPAIVFGARDRVTGKEIGARLSSAALTNNPFLDGMAPLAAKNTQTSIDSTVLQTINQALGVPSIIADGGLALFTLSYYRDRPLDDATIATVMKLREALRLPLTMSTLEVLDVTSEACGAVRKPVDVSINLANDKNSPAATPVATNNNAPATAKEPIMEVTDNKKELEVSQLTLKLSAVEAESKALLATRDEQIAKLTADNAALKKQVDEASDREIAVLVDTAIQVWGEKKGLTAESKPHLLRFAKNDREGFLALYPQPAAGQPRPVGMTIASGQHEVPGPVIEGPNNVIRMKDVITDAKIPSMKDCVRSVNAEAAKAGITLSYDEAFSKAHQMRTDLINTAANKRLGFGG